MFLLNSRIPLVRFSSESIAHCTGVSPERLFQILAILAMHESTIHREQRQVASAQLKHKNNGSHYNPILRANPFPEVTDLICRIPLSTLFYRPEAANLGDLMRLWVRPGVFANKSVLQFFKGTVDEHHLTIRMVKVLCPPYIPMLWAI